MNKPTRTNRNHHLPSSFKWNKSIVNDLIDASSGRLSNLGAKRGRLIDRKRLFSTVANSTQIMCFRQIYYPGCQRLFMRGFRFRSSLCRSCLRPSAEHVSACCRRNEAPRRTRDKTCGTQGTNILPQFINTFL